MNNSLNPLMRLLGEKLKLLVSISLGIFLFFLFFEPFTLRTFDFNNSILFIAGFSGIIFFLLLGILIIHTSIFLSKSGEGLEFLPSSLVIDFIFVALSSVACTFYLRYVGQEIISFYGVSKIVLICISPPIALRISGRIEELNQQNRLLINEKKKLLNEVAQCEEEILSKSIEFVTENNAENLTLVVSSIAILKSADNYVEIVYKEAENFKKKLVRNTLKNIELQIKPYSNFVRCHRTCIVNTYFIEKLSRNYGNQWLIVKDYPDQLPVSRQYLLKLKEVL